MEDSGGQELFGQVSEIFTPELADFIYSEPVVAEELGRLTAKYNKVVQTFGYSQEDISREIENLNLKVQNGRASIDQIKAEIADLEDKVLIKEVQLLTQLTGYFETQRLKKKLLTKKSDLVVLVRDQEAAYRLLIELEAVHEGKVRIESAERDLYEFYARQNLTLAERQKLELEGKRKEAINLANALDRHNALCIHMIGLQKPGEHRRTSVIRSDKANWQNQLNIVLGLAPELATSTIREGNLGDGLVNASCGVVILDGEITYALGGDAGTSVLNQKRVPDYLDYRNCDDLSRMTSEIDKAMVSNASPGRYNEVVVDKPKIGALFVRIKSKKRAYKIQGYERRNDFEHDNLEAVFRSAEEYGLPVYTRDNDGNFIVLTYNFDQGEVMFGEIVTAKEINMGKVIAGDVASQARENVFDDCPFKLASWERRAFDAVQKGRELYLALYNGELPIDIQANRRAIDAPSEWSRSSRIDIGAGFIDTGVDCIDLDSISLGLEKYLRNYVALNKQELVEMNDKLVTYRAMGASYQKNQEKLRKDIERFEENYKQHIFVVAAYANGIVDAALEFGDQAIAERFISIVEGYYPRLDYVDFIVRRTGKNGGFKMVESDLKDITT